MSRNKEQKFFYGWVIIGGCLLLSAASGIISGVLSTFIRPVSEALGVSRSAFSMTNTAINITIMSAMPFVDQIFTKVPFKLTVILACCMASLSLIGYSFAKSIGTFYLLSVVCGLSNCFMNAVPIVILISNWFFDKRGVATSISFAGMGISGMLLSPVAAYVIEQYSYHAAYRLLGITFFLLSVPYTLLLVRVKPEDMGLKALGADKLTQEAAHNVKGFTYGESIRQPSFWLFATAIFLISLTAFGVQQHCVSYWVDLGYSSVSAANWFSLMMAVGIAGKIATGTLYDHTNIKRASALLCIMAAASYLLFLGSQISILLLLGVALFGLSAGVQTIPPTYVTNRLFGDRDYSKNYGLITTIYYFGMAVGIQFSAFCFDTFHSYRPAFTLYAAFILFALGLIFMAEKAARNIWRKRFGTDYRGNAASQIT